MMNRVNYREAFYFSLGLHVFLILMLLVDTSTSTPTLIAETQNAPGIQQPMKPAVQEVVKAVSVENKEVMETVNRLKQEREAQKHAELNRQKELNRQLDQAKQQRIKEQQHIAQLKEEANKIAIARKKQVLEEQKRLQQLADQKALEAKHIEELKKQKETLLKQQEIEAKKLAELNKKKAEEKKIKANKLKLEQARLEQLKAEKAQEEKERKKLEAEASALQARQHAENQARIAGEVDKYKALIVNAIGRNWILPENVDSALSSQFRIRLAPDGSVQAVTLTRSSGDPLLDRSAQTAIYKASPLPVPTGETFNLFRDISLTVRPEQIRG